MKHLTRGDTVQVMAMTQQASSHKPSQETTRITKSRDPRAEEGEGRGGEMWRGRQGPMDLGVNQERV